MVLNKEKEYATIRAIFNIKEHFSRARDKDLGLSTPMGSLSIVDIGLTALLKGKEC